MMSQSGLWEVMSPEHRGIIRWHEPVENFIVTGPVLIFLNFSSAYRCALSREAKKHYDTQTTI